MTSCYIISYCYVFLQDSEEIASAVLDTDWPQIQRHLESICLSGEIIVDSGVR